MGYWPVGTSYDSSRPELPSNKSLAAQCTCGRRNGPHPCPGEIARLSRPRHPAPGTCHAGNDFNSAPSRIEYLLSIFREGSRRNGVRIRTRIAESNCGKIVFGRARQVHVPAVKPGMCPRNSPSTSGCRTCGAESKYHGLPGTSRRRDVVEHGGRTPGGVRTLAFP